MGPPGDEDHPWYPLWYPPLDAVRRAAAYLGTDFFVLLDRIKAGETDWVEMAIVAERAQQQADEIKRWWNVPPTMSA